MSDQPDEEPTPAEIADVIDGPLVFPQAGSSLVPTPADIAAGRFGNGSWDFTDGSVDVAYEAAYQAKKDDLDERRHFFNEAAKDALKDAVDLHHRAIKVAQTAMEKAEAGEQLNRTEMFLLNKGLASAKELSDRAAGRAKITTEHTENVTTLSMLLTKDASA